jgi:hypothetical protein
MSELIQLAPLQIQSKVCVDFTRYFIEHAYELARNKQEVLTLDSWRRNKNWANNLFSYPMTISSMSADYNGCGELYVRFSAGPYVNSYYFAHADQPIEDLLYNYLTDNMAFVTWYEENFFNAANPREFKHRVIDKFLETYPPATKTNWMKMGVVFKNANK